MDILHYFMADSHANHRRLSFHRIERRQIMNLRKQNLKAAGCLVTAACLLAACGTPAAGPGENAPAESAAEISSESVPSEAEEGPGTPMANYVVHMDTSGLDQSHAISDTLYGIFLEDINHALDGGLYAELVKNRSFEYGDMAGNQGKHGWTVLDSTETSLDFTIIDGTEDGSSLHGNNPHYARLINTGGDMGPGIFNKGYLNGMQLQDGEEYVFSVYLRTPDHYDGPVVVSLIKDGVSLASGQITGITKQWNQYQLTLQAESSENGISQTASQSLPSGTSLLLQTGPGTVDVDMVSLMPADTYKGLPIRKDLGEMLEALNPSFLRFPGGCVIEGRDEESLYSWKDSIGSGARLTLGDMTTTGGVEVRPQSYSIWKGTKNHPYYTTYGIGFYEFFELCEALDCLPVPVLNAGMTCQVQSPKYIVYDINSDQFRQCVQDALDLVEFCRGDDSTHWGSVRIAMGHEEPFALKYIGIGNEQWQSEYFQHYRRFVEAFNEAAQKNPALYGDIRLTVANSTSSGDRVGWNYVEDCADWGDEITTLVDEHYYEPPSFFFTNTHRYDSYDRDSQAKVFLGEYAAQSNTLEAALAEAAYMTGLEKNGDVVEMACYAPLFGNKLQSQWKPDMIWFDNASVYGSVNYYVQQLYGNNKGIINLPTELSLGKTQTQGLSGGVGLGSWQTSVAYDNLKVTSNATGEVLYQADFQDEEMPGDLQIWRGDWAVDNGRLVQSHTGDPQDGNTGDSLYVGDGSWTDYTLTVEGEVISGPEGFLIPICVQDAANNMFWNIGGWGNTVSCLQIVSGGSKSGQISGTVKNVKLQQGKVYQIKVVVAGSHVEGYLDDVKYLDYTYQAPESLYESANVDENGDLIIKLVNPTDQAIVVDTRLEGFVKEQYEERAQVTVLSGDSPAAVNSFEEPEKMIPVISETVIGDTFLYEAPAYSLTVLRIPAR